MGKRSRNYSFARTRLFTRLRHLAGTGSCLPTTSMRAATKLSRIPCSEQIGGGSDIDAPDWRALYWWYARDPSLQAPTHLAKMSYGSSHRGARNATTRRHISALLGVFLDATGAKAGF